MAAQNPVAYLITFSTYGTWLHGDARGSQHHRRTHHGAARIGPSARWESAEQELLTQPPVRLDRRARIMVERVAREVCEHRGWSLVVANARTSHVHVVVASSAAAEQVLQSVKAWATRRLVEAGAVEPGCKVWSRHGSTVHLWTRESVERAAWYVRYEQDEREGWR